MPGLDCDTKSEMLPEIPEVFQRRWQTGTLASHIDQTPLRYGFIPPETPEDRCFVVLNGRGEFLEKYLDLIHDLQLSEGSGVLMWDHRGQGKSGGQRAWVEDFHHYSLDGEMVIQKLLGDRSYTMLAHSMGGLIALHGILQKRFSPEKLFLSSPFLGLPEKPWPPAVARVLCRTFTMLGLGKKSLNASLVMLPFEKNILTHCQKRYQRMLDFDGRVGDPTFQWVVSAVRALRDVHSVDMFDSLKGLDVFMAQAGLEQVVSSAVGDGWARRAKQHGVALRLVKISGAFHELLGEAPEFYDQVIKEIRDWI